MESSRDHLLTVSVHCGLFTSILVKFYFMSVIRGFLLWQSDRRTKWFSRVLVRCMLATKTCCQYLLTQCLLGPFHPLSSLASFCIYKPGVLRQICFIHMNSGLACKGMVYVFCFLKSMMHLWCYWNSLGPSEKRSCGWLWCIMMQFLIMRLSFLKDPNHTNHKTSRKSHLGYCFGLCWELYQRRRVWPCELTLSPVFFNKYVNPSVAKVRGHSPNPLPFPEWHGKCKSRNTTRCIQQNTARLRISQEFVTLCGAFCYSICKQFHLVRQDKTLGLQNFQGKVPYNNKIIAINWGTILIGAKFSTL